MAGVIGGGCLGNEQSNTQYWVVGNDFKAREFPAADSGIAASLAPDCQRMLPRLIKKNIYARHKQKPRQFLKLTDLYPPYVIDTQDIKLDSKKKKRIMARQRASLQRSRVVSCPSVIPSTPTRGHIHTRTGGRIARPSLPLSPQAIGRTHADNDPTHMHNDPAPSTPPRRSRASRIHRTCTRVGVRGLAHCFATARCLVEPTPPRASANPHRRPRVQIGKPVCARSARSRRKTPSGERGKSP
ncbi:hypothetical protein C8J57DRAFT_1643409, partial [Mycena rebaudengoi]